MIEAAEVIRPGASSGRWILGTMLGGDRWEVVLQPDELDLVIVVITAYKAEAR